MELWIITIFALHSYVISGSGEDCLLLKGQGVEQGNSACRSSQGRGKTLGLVRIRWELRSPAFDDGDGEEEQKPDQVNRRGGIHGGSSSDMLMETSVRNNPGNNLRLSWNLGPHVVPTKLSGVYGQTGLLWAAGDWCWWSRGWRLWRLKWGLEPGTLCGDSWGPKTVSWTLARVWRGSWHLK